VKLRYLYLAVLSALSIQWAGAQPFGITAQIGQTTAIVSPGGTLNVAASAIGSATPVRITVSYLGSTSANITNVGLAGSGDFSSTGVATPLQLKTGGSFTISLTYTPTSGQSSQGQVVVAYLEDQATVPSTFNININGTSPDLVYSYAFSGGNAQAVGDGALIQFPTTTVNATSTANFTILNRGSAPGTVTNISLTGAAFQLGGLQIPPYTVAANSGLSFTVTFAPTDRTAQTGTLVITFAGRNYTFNLQGTGTAAVYTYTIVRADSTTLVVQPGQSISFPDTNVGSTANLTLLIANNGNGPGTITAISVAGSGFQIANTPFLPATLAVGAQTQLTLTFAPTTPGNATGGLKIGDDTFNLAGVGIGPLLTYAYTIGSTNSPVSTGGTILFSPAKLGDSATLGFTVSNTGNATAAINTIFLTGSPAFSLSGLPGLPFNLAPNASSTFSMRFAPSSAGVSQGSLQIGSATFAVSGSALAPDPLPQIAISGPTGQVQPLQQPAYKLTLQQPYSIDLVGNLNIAFSSSVFAVDPSVQFASGGNTASFFIPAGATNAIFLNNSNQIAIQTGSVAGTINIYPTFATVNGIDLTPATVPFAVLNVPQSAPQITGLSIANQSATGLTLAITGYATSRSVTQLQLTLTPAAGQNVTNTSLTIPVDSGFQAWYQTASSQSAGSAFTATLPLSLSGNSTAPSQLTKAIQSISVTLTNAQGTSPSQTVTVP